MGTYQDFLLRKTRKPGDYGSVVNPEAVHSSLHDWQQDIVRWAVRAGRAAIWADTGLGKSRMQVEWARLSGRRSLIVAPLAVCHQTAAEAAAVGVSAAYVRSGTEASAEGTWITNYEMIEHFDPAMFDAVVLDEASILKNADGKTRAKLIRHFADVPRRLACTATPAPNDPQELTNQAEFLGRSTRTEMLAAYFIHDGDGWRMKGHAREPMFRWMASWAVALRRPSDLGYADNGYILPPLKIVPHMVSAGEVTLPGELVPIPGHAAIKGVTGRAAVRKATVRIRVDRAVELVKADVSEPWLLWAGRNDEAALLAASLPGAVNVEGTWTPDAKADALLGFARGDIPILVTKPSIAGFGMNWQHCARMAFVGLSDSYEQYYQCIRRCWRYGQQRPVEAHVVLSDVEEVVAQNVARKESEAAALVAALVEAIAAHRMKETLP